MYIIMHDAVFSDMSLSQASALTQHFGAYAIQGIHIFHIYGIFDLLNEL